MSLFVDIQKTFGSFSLNVKLQAEDEVLALLGASGSGKSLTLKCIAGIEKPDKGKIVLDGVTLFDSEQGISLPPQKRKVGLLFQNYALFPHMTVSENIETGFKREKKVKKRKEMVKNMAEIFGLTAISDLYPHQISGGEQQRVALARVLASEPNILLLDEPFSALDSHLRFRLEQEVRQTLRQFGKTVLLVSHDRDEVYRMADSIALLENGKIDAIGEKKSVFASPKSRNGAILTGCKNISEIQWTDENTLFASDWGITLKVPKTDAAYVGIRMHHIQPGDGENTLRCRVVEEIENPFSFTIMLEYLEGKAPIAWELDKDQWKKLKAEEVDIHIPSDAILLLKA